MGHRLKVRREAMALSRKDLSKALSLTVQYIGDVENGSKGMSVETLYKMAQVLELSVDYIFDGEGPDLSDDDKKQRLKENIIASLSVCSLRQLYRIEQITRLFVEGMVDDE